MYALKSAGISITGPLIRPSSRIYKSKNMETINITHNLSLHNNNDRLTAFDPGQPG